jgi:group I intron endonuclease
MAMQSGIYQIRNLVNGKRYIGSAVDMGMRFHGHRSDLRLAKHANRYLQAAWNKHGEEKFAFEIVLLCDKSNLILYEQIVMDFIRASDRRFGYNIRKMAESNLGLVASEETRRKISSVVRGRRHTEDAKKKISDKNKGKKRPQHVIQILKETHRGNKYRVGKKHTPESIALMSINRIGKGTGKRPASTGQNISASLMGHKVSQDTKEKIARGQLAHQRKMRMLRADTSLPLPYDE